MSGSWSTFLRLTRLLVVLLIAACRQSDEAPNYFPLSAGMHWQYRIERVTMDGAQQLRHLVTNIAPVMFAGGSAAARETVDGTRHFYRIEDTGIYNIGALARDGRPAAAGNAPRLVLPRPLELESEWHAGSHTSVLESSGPPWETLFRISVPVDMTYRVESLDAAVDTPAGRFTDCLLVAGHGMARAEIGSYIGRTEIEISSREWYAPGVGLVRMERLESTGAPALDAGRLTMVLDYWRRD